MTTAAILMLFFSDTSSVNIRALVARDMNQAVLQNQPLQHQAAAQQPYQLPDFVLVIELGLIIMMVISFVLLIVHFRKIRAERKKTLAAAQTRNLVREQMISRAEIERILGQIAAEKVQIPAIPDNMYVTRDGRLNSNAVIHEMARDRGLESERLNFAISYASQAARKTSSKFKEAFAMVDENADLNILARQLNMGKGELELILALKKTKIANSRSPGRMKEGDAR